MTECVWPKLLSCGGRRSRCRSYILQSAWSESISAETETSPGIFLRKVTDGLHTVFADYFLFLIAESSRLEASKGFKERSHLMMPLLLYLPACFKISFLNCHLKINESLCRFSFEKFRMEVVGATLCASEQVQPRIMSDHKCAKLSSRKRITGSISKGRSATENNLSCITINMLLKIDFWRFFFSCKEVVLRKLLRSDFLFTVLFSSSASRHPEIGK